MWSFLNGWRIVVMVSRRRGMCRWQMGHGPEGGRGLRSEQRIWGYRIQGQSLHLRKNSLIDTESAKVGASGTGWHGFAA